MAVKWEEPLDDGGAPITGYIIDYTKVTFGDSVEFIITGLSILA